jgi:antitoxin HicB
VALTIAAKKRLRAPLGARQNKRAPHFGASVEDFLKHEGIFEEAQAQAVKEVVAWQLAKAMKKKKISKARMASLLKTSRTQVDRLLDPACDITLSSLQRAAAMVGRRVTIELV